MKEQRSEVTLFSISKVISSATVTDFRQTKGRVGHKTIGVCFGFHLCLKKK